METTTPSNHQQELLNQATPPRVKQLMEGVRNQVSVTDVAGVTFIEASRFRGHVCEDMYGSHPYGLYAIPQGVVFGAFGVFISSSLQIIREQNYEHLSEDALMQNLCATMKDAPDAASCQHIPHVISLTSPCCSCFWHWMMDSLPKVLLAEACGYTGTYLIPNPQTCPWAAESLALLEIPPTRVVQKSTNIIITDYLYIPTYFSGFEAYNNFIILNAYRSRMRQILHARSGGGTPERIFVPRKPTARLRRITNLEQTHELTQRFGFTTLFFEDLPLREQLLTAFAAKAIVTPHGSGMTHTLFMPHNSLVVELYPYEHRESCACYRRLMPIAAHRYFSRDTATDQGLDIEVDLDDLEQLLSSAL